jgi:hypothetical protein
VAFALQHVRQLQFDHDTYLGPEAFFSTLISAPTNIIAKLQIRERWISEVTGYPKHIDTSIHSMAFEKAGTLAAHPNLPLWNGVTWTGDGP